RGAGRAQVVDPRADPAPGAVAGAGRPVDRRRRRAGRRPPHGIVPVSDPPDGPAHVLRRRGGAGDGGGGGGAAAGGAGGRGGAREPAAGAAGGGHRPDEDPALRGLNHHAYASGAGPPGPGKMASSRFVVSASSFSSRTATASSSCWAVRGPMIGAVT